MGDYYNDSAGSDISLFNDFGGGSSGGDSGISAPSIESSYIDFTNSGSDDTYDNNWLFGDDFFGGDNSFDAGGSFYGGAGDLYSGGDSSGGLFGDNDIGGGLPPIGDELDSFLGDLGHEGIGSGGGSGNPLVDLLRERDQQNRADKLAEADKPWWDKAMESPAFWSGMMTLFGFGFKEYQRQQDQDRADEQDDKDYERQKDLLQYKEDLYKQRYDLTHSGGGGGGAAPADTGGGYKYNPNVKTGTFEKKA